MNRLILFIFIILGPLQTWAESGCLFTKDNVLATSASDGSETPFSKGRILPYRDYDAVKQSFLVTYRGQEYWMPGKSTKVGSANLCSLEPRCFTVSKISSIYREISTEGTPIAKAIRGQNLVWAGQFKRKGTAWIQVEVGDSYGWIPAGSGKVENRACPQSENAQKPRFSFSVEAGYEMGVQSSNYDKAIKPTPAPNDNVEYTLPDPFYTELKPGTGFFVAGIIGLDLKDRYRFEAGAGYASYSYALVTYDNPSNYEEGEGTDTGIPFSSLIPKDTPITESYVLFPTGAYYKFGGRNRWSMKVGARIDFLYVLSKPFEYFYYEGDKIKRQKSQTFSIGPAGLISKQSLELRPQYRLNNSMELGLIYRYSTWGSHSLSFWTEF